MDTTLTAAVTKIAELPLDAQREIGAALLRLGLGPEAELPVIEFGEG